MALRLARDVSTVDTGNGVVLLDERAGRYFQLNGTGGRILTELLDGRAPGDVADGLARSYGVSAADAARDVDNLVAQLRQSGLVAS